MRLKREPVAAVELIDRAGLASVTGKPGMPDFLASLGPDATALLVEIQGADESEIASRVQGCRGRPCRHAARAPGRIQRRSLSDRKILEAQKGPVSGRRRGAAGRHDGHHRGRRGSDRPARGRDRRSAGRARAARLPGSDHFRPCARRQSAFRLRAGLRRSGGDRSLRRADGRGRRHHRRALRRLAQGRARHRPQHGALRRDGMGQAGDRADVADQAAVRPFRPAQPRRRAQRRRIGPPEELQADAGDRSVWSTGASNAASASRSVRPAG